VSAENAGHVIFHVSIGRSDLSGTIDISQPVHEVPRQGVSADTLSDQNDRIQKRIVLSMTELLLLGLNDHHSAGVF
jgi:hypothetical protein